MRRWRRVTEGCGAMNGSGGPLLNSVPGSIKRTFISASSNSCPGVWTLSPLTISLRPSLLQFLLQNFIDLKKPNSQHGPCPAPHPLSFSVRVHSVPAAMLMHCYGQLDWRDAGVLQRYAFISGLVNHSLWCGIIWTGGDQLPRFEMSSGSTVSVSELYWSKSPLASTHLTGLWVLKHNVITSDMHPISNPITQLAWQNSNGILIQQRMCQMNTFITGQRDAFSCAEASLCAFTEAAEVSWPLSFRTLPWTQGRGRQRETGWWCRKQRITQKFAFHIRYFKTHNVSFANWEL